MVNELRELLLRGEPQPAPADILQQPEPSLGYIRGQARLIERSGASLGLMPFESEGELVDFPAIKPKSERWFQRIENPESEYWDLSKEDRIRFNAALALGGSKVARKEFPAVTQPPYYAHGHIASMGQAFLEGLGIPRDEWQQVAEEWRTPTGWKTGAAVVGEIAKYVALIRLLPLKGLAAETAAAGIVGARRQIGAEKPSIDAVFEEMAAVGATAGVLRGTLSGLRRGQKVYAVSRPVVKTPTVRETKVDAPITDITPEEAAMTVGFFGYTPELAKSIQQSWEGVVNTTTRQAAKVIPAKIRDFTKGVAVGHVPPELRQIMRDKRVAISMGRLHADDLAKIIEKEIPKKHQYEVYKTLDPTHIGDLGEFPIEFQAIVRQARNKIDELGQEAVGLGLFDAETYYKNVGEYMGRYYKPHELLKKRVQMWSTQKWFRTGIKGERFKHRKLETTAEREAAGLITDPSYAVSNTIKDLVYDVETAKMFRRISQNPEWVSTVEKEGFRYIPKSKKFGDLAGKFVNKDIQDELKQVLDMRSVAGRIYDSSLSLWKLGKTAYSPATQGRNIFSNTVLADWGGLSPYRLDIYAKAFKDYIGKGPIYREAQAAGLMGTDWFGAEIGPVLSPISKAKGSMFSLAFELPILKQARKIVAAPARFYQGTEQFFKLSLYHLKRLEGMSPTKATAYAHKYLFDYSDLSPFLHKLRRSPFGGPFLTFTAKMLPIAVETAVKHPVKFGKYFVLGKMINEYSKAHLGISDDDALEIRRNLPPWRRNGLQLFLPVRDKNDRPIMWDLTYNMPWGDIAEQGTYIPVPIIGNIVERFVGSNPFFRIPAEYMTNVDIFRQKPIYRYGMETRGEAYAGHAYRQLAPGIARAVPKVYGAVRGEPTPSGEAPDPLVTTLDQLFGLRFYSFDLPKGKRINLAGMMKKRDELISSLYRIGYDQSLSQAEKDKKIAFVRREMDKLIQEHDRATVTVRPIKEKKDGVDINKLLRRKARR